MMGRRIGFNDVKRIRKIRRIKIPFLVVSAIKNMRNMKGATSNKIVNYVAKVSDISKSSAKRRVEIALKRAVNHGVLKYNRGHYFLGIDLPFFKNTNTKSSSSTIRRSSRINKNSMKLRKVMKNEKRIKQFRTVVRKPILSLRKSSRNTKNKSSPHQLSDMYFNLSYKDSTNSSIASSVSKKSLDIQEISDIFHEQK